MSDGATDSLDRRAAARFLLERASSLAVRVTERHFALVPDLEVRYGAAGREACTRDAVRHIEHLAHAVESNSPALFIDYLGWAKVLLEKLAIPGLDLAVNVASLDEVLATETPLQLVPLVRAPIALARDGLSALPTDVASFLEPGLALSSLARAYLDALLAGDRRGASGLVLAAVDGGTDVRRVYLDVFQRCQYEIGRLWQLNRITVAQEHFCTAATQLVMSQLYDRIFSVEKRGRSLVATCATNDLHEIGIRMVSDFFEMEGWDTFYLGANTPVRAIVRELAQRQADVLAVSVTLTTHLGYLREVVRAVRDDAALAATRVVVGGYPFGLDADLWRKVGADGTAPDALSAVAVAEKLLAGGP